MGSFRLNLIEGKTSPIVTTPNPERNNKPELPHNDPRLVTVTEIKDLKQTLEIEIGYGDTNAWVEWVKFSVLALNKSDCYVCAARWPQAQVVPFPLCWDTDPTGMNCMLALYQDKDAWGNETCKGLSLLFHALKKSDPRAIPSFSIGKMNHSSCLSRQGEGFKTPMENLLTCTHVLNVSKEGNFSKLHIP